MKVVKEHFQSIHQMLENINKRPKNEVMRGRESASYTGSEDFTLTESWDKAIYLFKYGYTDILEEIKTGMKTNASFQKPVAKRRIKTHVEGVVPHIPNAILGLPNSMIHIQPNIQKTKAISIVYVKPASCMVDAREFVESGIAVLSTIHALEIRGFRVNLKVMFFNGKVGDERVFSTVDVKHYREHLDLHKLCFPIAHPSMFRRIGFKWLETTPEIEESGWARAYGKPVPVNEILEIEGLAQKNEYYISLATTKECNYNVDEIIEYLNVK